MSDTIISPIFKLNFEQTNGTFTDLTGNAYDATATPATAVTPVANDPEMGRCLQFDGTAESFCKISEKLSDIDISNGLTMTAWVNVKAYSQPFILLLVNDAGNIAMQINASGAPYYWNSQTTKNLSSDGVLTSPDTLPLSSWQHLAVTVDTSGLVTIYINGQVSKQGTSSDYKSVAGTLTSITVGSESFNGMMAWVALYDGPLGQAGVLGDMAEGQTKRVASFRQSMPIGFKLYSDDGGAENPIMFIEDEGAGEDLNLRVTNNSSKPITYQKNSDPVSSTNFHFQLRFRPGVLSENFLNNYSQDSTAKKNPKLPKLLTNNPDWTAVVNGGADSTDTISFLYNGDNTTPLGKGENDLIVVSAVNASATGGSRNTNVELRYQNIQLGAATTPITGHRKQNVSIVNHSGEKEIPLRAEIVGNAGVMTYTKPAQGSPVANPPQTNLMFRIVNTSANPLPLALPDNADGATTFTLSIDVQPTGHLMEWALIDQADIAGIKVELNKLGVVRSLKGMTLELESPLIESIENNTDLQITGGSTPIKVTTSGAKAGSYSIPLSAGPQNDTVKPGYEIELANNQSNWLAQPKDSSEKKKSGGHNGKGSQSVITDASGSDRLEWTIGNQSVKALAPGGGICFLLKGIQCSLPSGSSIVTLRYANVPGHWDGAFELPVDKSPLAFNQNLMGVNTQAPTASLHIAEDASTTPFKIEKEKGGNQLILQDYVGIVNELQLEVLDAAKGYFYQNQIINDGHGYSIQVWNLAADKPATTSLALPPLPVADNIFPDGNLGSFFYNQGHLYVFVNVDEDNSYILYFTLNSPGAPTSLTYENLLHIGDLQIDGQFFVANGNAYFQCQESKLPQRLTGLAESPQSAPSLVLQPLKSSSIPGSSSVALLAADRYLYLATDSDFLVCSVDASGNLTTEGKVSVDWVLFSSAQLEDGLLYVYNGSNDIISILDVSDPTQPRVVCDKAKTPIQGSLDNGSLNYIVHEGFVFVPKNNVLNIYAFDGIDSLVLYNTVSWLPDFQLLHIGKAGEKIYLWGPARVNNGKWAIFTFDQNDFYNYCLGRSTYITSGSISIGAYSPLQNGLLAINDRNGDTVFTVNESGFVGIGTDDPKAPLHVESHVVDNIMDEFVTYRYGIVKKNENVVRVGATTNPAMANMANISIRASHKIRASQFYAISDARIKEFITLSCQTTDLAMLLNLKVSNYQHIDFVGNGATRKKGLIAQQVKEVFPQAVSAETTDFVPNIYDMATSLHWQPFMHQLRVNLLKAHELKVGDKVRVLAEKDFEEKEVVAVPDDQSFVISEWGKPVDKLFVFGKEVHDFHTVDYDQVAMLGVSAIQALHAEVEQLKKEKDALKAQMQSEMAELKAEWAAFKSSMTKQHQN